MNAPSPAARSILSAPSLRQLDRVPEALLSLEALETLERVAPDADWSDCTTAELLAAAEVELAGGVEQLAVQLAERLAEDRLAAVEAARGGCHTIGRVVAITRHVGRS